MRRGQWRHPADSRQSGFTMIELTVVMVVAGILMALGTAGWSGYRQSVEHRGSAQELVAALRNAQQASLAEAVTYCVAIDSVARSYTTYKFACGSTGTVVKSESTQSARVQLVNPVFAQPDGTTAAAIVFAPRGSASRGSVKVLRSGSSKVYNVSVEGLTGRVSLAG